MSLSNYVLQAHKCASPRSNKKNILWDHFISSHFFERALHFVMIKYWTLDSQLMQVIVIIRYNKKYFHMNFESLNIYNW